ncbi:hypothetical protein [uncultured Jannaschia sp.]|uniref:hypothetical protein n=1 Tax=uncultured Jannaschia sp. TaxID=293347 RepID=UPI002632D376|nr:hypothetical protein [uncultured Jannaschia sp.]
MWRRALVCLFALVLNSAAAAETRTDPSVEPPAWQCSGFDGASLDGGVGDGRLICADIAALDQTLVYNRFGSFNPFGMIFALRRDLVPLEVFPETGPPTHATCRDDTGTVDGGEGLSAGVVRLRDCKRPRPLVLRAGVSDTIVVRVTNYLRPAQTADELVGDGSDTETAIDFTRDFCGAGPADGAKRTDDANRAAVHPALDWDDAAAVAHGEADCVLQGTDGRVPDMAIDTGDADAVGPGMPDAGSPATEADWPNTRTVNLVAQGLTPVAIDGAIHPACRGLGGVAPDEGFTCAYRILQEGTYFFASNAAPAGGEGDGGSIVHGLFGAILGEETGTEWYRSQVSETALDAVWDPADDAMPRHARASADIRYDATVDDTPTGMPYLRMLRAHDAARAGVQEIVHADINAIVYCTARCAQARQDRAKDLQDTVSVEAGVPRTSEPHYRAFREFSVFFHDELKTFYTENFRELGEMGQLAGVKDGFAINYGASGMGSILLANRKGIGPSAGCMECLYEEFFLTSWANGDPALLEWYSDDPSNVHHSYLNDPVVFRNFHAGPKETHVFHLHAHQWFAGNDPGRGAYLDSQTVAPQQGFTYNIYHGGLRAVDGSATDGRWNTRGSGNRNRTVGDSIFHCHLYPHFAQGMWALWRVHDVLEDGTRLMPDGQPEPGLSTSFTLDPDGSRTGHVRKGSVDRQTGAWIPEQDGTPIPAVVPLPGEPLPLLPSYAAEAEGEPMPGYPFYIPGTPGHRPPQAPLDIARRLTEAEDTAAPVDARQLETDWLDGGIGRHVVGDASSRSPDFALPAAVTAALGTAIGDDRVELLRQLVAKAFALGNLTMHLDRAEIELLSNEGETLERNAMGFHHDGRVHDPEGGTGAALALLDALGAPSSYDAGYTSPRAPVPEGPAGAVGAGRFYVNGSPPRPGAPYADPCGVASGTAAATQTDPTVDSLATDDAFNLANYSVDPLLTGFRRYEVSAVQLDLIVNQAGWHDPQARINVLTADSHGYKTEDAPERVSPAISDREEPFFFRAISGECIEFRHTNELPKDLELDDFQVKTPTDTIGQHIHLVKFDVTSSDGSANGWNYEDGTFAADELAARRCAAMAAGESVAALSPGIAGAGEANDGIGPLDCEGADAVREIWWRPLEAERDAFQTTVQRWFADPVLTLDEEERYQDRTLRTVFTHDHFAPSSIQQHGFYGALVIEPSVGARDRPEGADATLGAEAPETILAAVCETESAECVGPLSGDARMQVARGGDGWTGAQKRVMFGAQDTGLAQEPYHRNYREFALSIADFALLYDPRDRESATEVEASVETIGKGDGAGMAQLLCELRWRQNAWGLDNVCGNRRQVRFPDVYFGEILPAWLASGRPGDPSHRLDFDLILDSDLADLRDHLLDYRADAAGLTVAQGAGTARVLASPVAPPRRPEAISVDHHDPYLVNYRGAPIPLRVGTKDMDGVAVDGPARPWDASQHPDCAPLAMARPGHEGPRSDVAIALETGGFPECSIDRQRAGQGGDLAFVFDSRTHRDPETPLLEAYAGERLVFRMIQGAQEVQHTFRLDGQTWQRNIDQEFPRGMLPLDATPDLAASPRLDCIDRGAVGRPLAYPFWRDTPTELAQAVPGFDAAFWSSYAATLADCDNIEGFAFAQEIGISEHFELQGSLRADVGGSLELAGRDDGPGELAALDEVPRDVSDYRYDFGSVDALWNGAWGLLRVYADGDAIDPATNGPLNAEEGLAPAAIGDRLVYDPGGFETPGVEPDATLVGGGLACPIPAPGETQRVVRAVAAAVETRAIWPDGTIYRVNKTDRDGLMLALLAPSDLTGMGEDLADVTRSEVHAAVAARYGGADGRPEPFVLRVNAGDCVELTLVNALRATGGDVWAGLGDRLGDALMPPITPLNVGAVIDGPAPGERLGRIEPLPSAVADLRPSAHLALSVHLPSMTMRRDVPSGAGYNLAALPPATGDGVTVSAPLRFYAGRFRLEADGTALDAVEGEVESNLFDTARAFMLGDVAVEPTGFRLIRRQDGTVADTALGILSRRFDLRIEVSDPVQAALGLEHPDITITAADLPRPGKSAPGPIVATLCAPGAAACIEKIERTLAERVNEAQLFVALELDRLTHWIPYAFGPVPVTAVSDVISQPVHGLFGIVDVVPAAWDVDAADAGDLRPYALGAAQYCAFRDRLAGNGDDAEECLANSAADPAERVFERGHANGGDGLPALYALENGERLREFVLFYQDGLNHWDAGSAIEWRLHHGGPATDPETGGPVRPVPNCPVCDDSYDRGERGINYRSLDFAGMLRALHDTDVEVSDDLNVYRFETKDDAAFFDDPDALRLRACEGERILIRVVHPGGRARQRAFAMNGYTYDELFPGFGFPRSALLAPGKSISAWLELESEPGLSFWGDGPTQLRSGGVWGLLDVAARGDPRCTG